MAATDNTYLAPIWNGLGVLALALLVWLYFTPCDWQSPSLYLPPVLVGLLLGRKQGRRPWRLRLGIGLVYGLALGVLAAVIVFVTGGPPQALYTAGIVILLLVVPLAIAGLALGYWLLVSFTIGSHRFRAWVGR